MTIYQFILAQHDARRFKSPVTASRYAKLPPDQPVVTELGGSEDHLQPHLAVMEWLRAQQLDHRLVLIQEVVQWPVAQSGLKCAIEQTVAVELTGERDAGLFRQQFPEFDAICARAAA